ncbi:hypothetical protein SNEBB_000322 [Seison nebaliae]|nr:hypothetical protein SNEBB_000322 [Seison nebaliae]
METNRYGIINGRSIFITQNYEKYLKLNGDDHQSGLLLTNGEMRRKIRKKKRPSSPTNFPPIKSHYFKKEDNQADDDSLKYFEFQFSSDNKFRLRNTCMAYGVPSDSMPSLKSVKTIPYKGNRGRVRGKWQKKLERVENFAENIGPSPTYRKMREYSRLHDLPSSSYPSVTTTTMTSELSTSDSMESSAIFTEIPTWPTNDQIQLDAKKDLDEEEMHRYFRKIELASEDTEKFEVNDSMEVEKLVNIPPETLHQSEDENILDPIRTELRGEKRKMKKMKKKVRNSEQDPDEISIRIIDNDQQNDAKLKTVEETLNNWNNEFQEEDERNGKVTPEWYKKLQAQQKKNGMYNVSSMPIDDCKRLDDKSKKLVEHIQLRDEEVKVIADEVNLLPLPKKRSRL